MNDPKDVLICALLVDAMAADDELCRARKSDSDLLTLIEAVIDAGKKGRRAPDRKWHEAAEKMLARQCRPPSPGSRRGDRAVCARRIAALLHAGHEQVLAEAKRRGLPETDPIVQIIGDAYDGVRNILTELAEA